MAGCTPSHSFKLEIVERAHPQRKEVEQYISQRYELAFDAHLDAFMPTFLALMEEGEVRSLCGFRVASEEPLFLEQYLDLPADVLLTRVYGNKIARHELVEFGQLASFSKGFSAHHFLLMTEYLVESGYEWCIFTATDPLNAMINRLGLETVTLAEADPSRIPNATDIWGSYYQHQPRIVAGNLNQGVSQLRALFNQRTNRIVGGAQ